MRKFKGKRKNKKEKMKSDTKRHQNGANAESSTSSGSNENRVDSDDEPLQEKRSRKRNGSVSKRASHAEKKKPKAAEAEEKEDSDRDDEVVDSDDDDDDGSKENEGGPSQYEVEDILDQKNIKGARYFLIRWKGYGEESDTWEPERTLNCPQLLKAFKSKRKEENEKLKLKKQKKKPSKETANTEDWNSDDEFEVEKIIEVHHKRDGTRDFLVSWKGYPASTSSWEPENNLNCPDLIAKFMLKVEKAKEVDRHELREIRTPPARFRSNARGTRASKRHSAKQISYQE